MDHMIKANKFLRKAKQDRIFLKFHNPGEKENFRIVCFCDVSLADLKDGGSQRDFFNMSCWE